VIKQTRREGLLALFAQADFVPSTLSTYHINFVIAPRLNAMGRLAHGLDSLRLLCTHRADKAKQLAATLGSTNQTRQDLTWQLLQTAKNMVGKTPNHLIIIEHTDFHEGVIGLVAGKLAETYYRPAIVIGRGETVSKASARSIAGVNIIELIRKLDSLLINAGGHPMAAGFTIETTKITEFTAAITDLANSSIDPLLLEPTIKADVEIALTDLSWDLFQLLKSFEPFGIGNPQPVFYLPHCPVLETISLGQDKKHLKLILPSAIKDQSSLEALWFGHGSDADLIDKSVDLIATLDENSWRGHSKLQLLIKAAKAKSLPVG
jgi:single-stranded-DNA-specific exonuclease